MDRTSEGNLNGFRILLAVGALITFLGALGGLFAPGLLRGTLNLDVERDAPGYVAVARMLGAALLPLALGYTLAAIHPMRNRGLLLILFVYPLVGAIVLIVAVGRGEVARVNGSVFAAINLAYCLLYFRVYPKPVRTLVTGDEPEDGDQPPVIDQPDDEPST